MIRRTALGCAIAIAACSGESTTAPRDASGRLDPRIDLDATPPAPDAAPPFADATAIEPDAAPPPADAALPDASEDAGVPPVPGDFDLSTVTIVASPDVRGFAITSTITSLEFRPDNFHIDHTRRGQWPPVVIAPDGTTQEATVWVFFKINGTWYGTGGERLRPNQADKQLGNPSDIGPGWLYDPNRWGPMTNYVPAPGEIVGFMIAAGSTRSDNNVIVQERTGVVLVPFPPDGQLTSFPPFLWVER